MGSARTRNTGHGSTSTDNTETIENLRNQGGNAMPVRTLCDTRQASIVSIRYHRPNRLWLVLPISNHVTIPLGSLLLSYFLYTWHNFAWREICRRNQKISYQEIDHMT